MQGKAYPERTGFDEKLWTKDPLKFDNSYFGAFEGRYRWATEKALMDDSKFHCYVELYAKLWIKMHSSKTMLNHTRSFQSWVYLKSNTTAALLAQNAIGITIAATVVILSYLYELNRK
ncbi:hypothetical protein L1987_19060 [Smallanthus sonchifolius]|uniref:Uncharacterized protein n=1 Tax=Smallanthus sonchifolius TaxID=185202 RepID=A0ACB9J293_9ASTR|nr:hypothetical protein L1987_19060 [Smallanthus sonchifolius]